MDAWPTAQWSDTDQVDTDQDSVGDACDVCPNHPDPWQNLEGFDQREVCPDKTPKQRK